MRIPDETRDQLGVKFAVLFPHLDERQRRLLMAAEARGLGHGGIRAVARAAGVSGTTVRKGLSDLMTGQFLTGRARRPGGGRKRVADLDPGLRGALLSLVEPDERGDPMSPLRWTTKSTRTLAAELTRQGHRVGADTVAGLLRQAGFRLQANAKTLEGSQHGRLWRAAPLPQPFPTSRATSIPPDQLLRIRIQLSPGGPHARISRRCQRPGEAKNGQSATESPAQEGSVPRKRE